MICLLILAWLSIYLIVRDFLGQDDWRLTFLRSTSITAGYCVLTNELLSIFSLISRLSLAVVWGIPIVVVLHRYRGLLLPKLQRVKIRGLSELTIQHGVVLTCIFFVLCITAIVAWKSPPNTWDSLNTHMSRVAQWAQNRSLRPYATGIEKQNYYPPFPGIAILQSYVLTQGDYWANFVQWTAMALSVLAVSFVAKQLRASTTGQIFASLFAVTLPMGIAQATSTMTDYLVALWIIIVAVECIHLGRDDRWDQSIFFLSLPVALAVNSKPISFAYLFPFAIYVAIKVLQRQEYSRIIRSVLLCLIIILMINAGYLIRNVTVYGSFFGPQSGIGTHSNGIMSWQALVSNMVRNASVHARSNSQFLNDFFYKAIIKIHLWLRLSVTDPRTSVHESFLVDLPSTDENIAGNFFHALGILVSCVIVFFSRREALKRSRVFIYLVILSFLTLSFAFKFTIFGSRYHTAFFVLFAPIVGLAFSTILNPTVLTILAVMLSASSWNWLVGINSRPLLPKEEGGVSVMNSSREIMYFGGSELAFRSYRTVTNTILEQECQQVGIALGGAAAEYPLWVYLGAPDDDLYIGWIVRGPSDGYARSDVEYCAVICDTSCPEEWEESRGLPFKYDLGGLRLFIAE